MTILWITNVPAPYRVDFFNELGKAVELTVLFEKNTSDERDKLWLNYKFENFKGIILKGRSINTDTAICQSIIKYIKKDAYSQFVVTNISSPTGIMAILYMELLHIPYWIEGDGGIVSSGHWVKSALKKFILGGAYGCFSTGKLHDEYYRTYGVDSSRIYRYPFTSLKDEDIAYSNIFSKQEKRRLRSNLNIEEDNMLLSVGRFSYEGGYGKGFDVLVRVARKLGDSYGIYIVGDETTVEFIKWKEKEEINNIHFIEFQKKEELAKYYAASDCFILLPIGDVWKLAVNEAMVFGLPIITAPECVAGKEFVENEVNGYIISIDDIREIEEKIKKVILYENQAKFAKASLDKIQNCTIEKMAQTHFETWGANIQAIHKKIAREVLKLPDDKKIILYVGQMIHRKGIDILLKTVVQLSQNRNDFLFVLVGGILPKEYESLYRMIPKEQVRIIPYLEKKELRYCYRSADVFIFLTREDVWGLVVNEALANGLPVITTPYCGAADELVKKGENGIIVSIDDIAVIEKTINECMVFSQKCKHDEIVRTVQNYTIENMSKCHIQVFKKGAMV